MKSSKYALRKKKSEETRKRYSVVSSVISGAITMVVVVAMVVLAPTKATSQILELSFLGDLVYYHVKTQDPDATIDEGTLKVVLESPLTTVEESIDLGMYSGVFPEITENGTYTFSVRAKRGFGEEVLARQTIKKEATVGGRITAIREILHEHWLEEIQVDVVIVDPKNSFEVVWLIVQVEFEDGEWEEVERYEIHSPIQTIGIEAMYHGASTMRFLLMEETEEEEVLLHERIHRVAILPFGYLSMKQATTTTITIDYAVYASDIVPTKVVLVRSRNARVQEEIPLLVVLEEEEGYMHGEYIFVGLKEEEAYTALLIITYVDPQTKQTKSIQTEPTTITTVKKHQINSTIDIDDTGITVEVEVSGSIESVNSISVGIWRVEEEAEYFIYWGLVVFEIEGNTKSGSIRFTGSSDHAYRIIVIASKVGAEGITWSEEVINQIEYKKVD